MSPDDPLKDELAEYGAKTRVRELTEELKVLWNRYPHLQDQTPDVLARAPLLAKNANGAPPVLSKRSELLAGAKQHVARIRDKVVKVKASRKGQIAYSVADKDRIMLRARNEPLRDIAKHEDIPISTLRGWCKERGIPVIPVSSAEAERRSLASTAPRLNLGSPSDTDLTDLTGPDALGVGVLSAVIEHNGRITLEEATKALADPAELQSQETFNRARSRINFRIGVRVKAGHLKKVDTATYEITRRGREWLAQKKPI